MLADSTDGRCGSPAPTTMSGPPFWDSSWQAAHRAEMSGAGTSCISSMNRAMPTLRSAATDAASANNSVRSISRSPESARPRAAGTSMPSCMVTDVPFGALGSRSANALSTDRKYSIRSGARCRGASSRTAMCRAAATGRRIDCSGRASIFPVPHRRCMAMERNVFSRTVLPTPRRPVRTMLRSGRPRATRSSTTSNWLISRSRPVSSGGRWPAPGA